MIRELQPEFNIRDSVNSKYRCVCDPAITYSSRGAYEKHMNKYHPQIAEDLQESDEDYDDIDDYS